MISTSSTVVGSISGSEFSLFMYNSIISNAKSSPLVLQQILSSMSLFVGLGKVVANHGGLLN